MFCSSSSNTLATAVAAQGFRIGTWILPHLGWGCSQSKQLAPFEVAPYGSLPYSLFFYCPAVCFLHVWVLAFPCPSCVNSLVPLGPCAMAGDLCVSVYTLWGLNLRHLFSWNFSETNILKASSTLYLPSGQNPLTELTEIPEPVGGKSKKRCYLLKRLTGWIIFVFYKDQNWFRWGQQDLTGAVWWGTGTGLTQARILP